MSSPRFSNGQASGFWMVQSGLLTLQLTGIDPVCLLRTYQIGLPFRQYQTLHATDALRSPLNPMINDVYSTVSHASKGTRVTIFFVKPVRRRVSREFVTVSAFFACALLAPDHVPPTAKHGMHWPYNSANNRPNLSSSDVHPVHRRQEGNDVTGKGTCIKLPSQNGLLSAV